jgi:ABC-type nitrate/sulfonate/bicarbonate transport system substrate-binding protein
VKRTTIAIVLFILVACVVVGVIILSQSTTHHKYEGSPAQVTIGTPLFEVSGLIWIAEAQGYFAENGLNVTIKIFDAGKFAVSALFEGEVDVATASDFVFVGKAMTEEKIQTVGSLAKSDDHYLIVRKDGGVRRASDLKGKKIGFTRQTSAEFYLGRYLQLHGINLGDITPIDLKPTQVTEALAKGDLDAVLIWDPYAFSTEKSLGSKVVSWPAQSGQLMYWLLIAKTQYVTEHPELMDRLLNSFNQAEQFAVNYPDKAKKIVQNRLHTEDAYVERIWPRLRLTLALDQGLVIAMEDESRWMIDSNLASHPKMPYYPDYIYWQSLKKVKPSSVTVIH